MMTDMSAMKINHFIDNVMSREKEQTRIIINQSLFETWRDAIMVKICRDVLGGEDGDDLGRRTGAKETRRGGSGSEVECEREVF